MNQDHERHGDDGPFVLKRTQSEWGAYGLDLVSACFVASVVAVEARDRIGSRIVGKHFVLTENVVTALAIISVLFAVVFVAWIRLRFR